MKSSPAIVLVAALVSGSVHAAGARAPQRSNHVAPGNLESTSDIGCAASAALKSTYTPPDLYHGFAACLAQDDFGKAAFLFMLAGAYGRFDALRVADKSAHEALSVLRSQAAATIARSRREAFRDTVKAMSADPKEQAALCLEARRIGPPTYYPRYMVQHGLDAFMPAGESADKGLKTPFDARAAWDEILANYLHCR